MSSGYNQRAYTRVDISIGVSTVPAAGAAFEAEMVEISAGGMSVEHPAPLDIGTSVVCSFYANPAKEITLRGTVSWALDGRLGIQFTGYDTVSYLRFKDFLLDHAHDPRSVEDEFMLHLDVLPEAD